MKKKRQMTHEQREAAIERLAKAREARLAEAGPPKNVHPSVLARTDDFSYDNVKLWLKTQRELLAVAKASAKNEAKGGEAKVASIEGYIRNLDAYLKHGDWCNDFCGEYEQTKVKRICLALAYHHNGPYAGMVKRNVGVYYTDLGVEFTQEMYNDYYSIQPVETSKKKRVAKSK